MFMWITKHENRMLNGYVVCKADISHAYCRAANKTGALSHNKVSTRVPKCQCIREASATWMSDSLLVDWVCGLTST